MAYQIKSIRYQNEPRKILLQNENGPCPLLAAANALLLRGVITLSSECIRNGVASTDDVVNMLADRAISSQQNQTQVSPLPDDQQKQQQQLSDASSHHEFHLNEVLGLLPSLQHGMDVNIKFTAGPSGVEYTNNLAAFDLLGVELVHGWLLDPQDVETLTVVGNKSYNELIELVILGNESKDVIEKLEAQIGENQKLLEGGETIVREVGKGESQATKQPEAVNDAEPRESNSSGPAEEATNNEESSVASKDVPVADVTALSDEKKKSVLSEIEAMKKEISEQSANVSRAEIINAFLTASSHQLTYHGLHQLHEHINEDALCVFFRNNHFSTIVKSGGGLHLLVTDLGYANVPEVVWEKLDAIDGDTEYLNEFFEKPSPRTELKAADGPTISPELLLAQRSQAESDYQLALAMSKGQSPTNLDDDEGRLIDAATELSLREYNGDHNAAIKVSEVTSDRDRQIDSDHEMALAYQRAQQQSEHDSEQLARQLQELEYARQRPAGSSGRTRNARAPPALKPAASSNCVIS